MIDTQDDYEELTGPEAIQRALQELDIDTLESNAHAELKKKKKSTRKPSIQTIQAIDGIKKSGVKPHELMISQVPVIPPLFRPYAITGDTFMAGHSNELYRDLLESRKGYESVRETFGDEAAKEAGYNLYNATRALYGYGDAVNPKTKARGVTGFMSQILGGGSPKFSVPQRRLFSKTTDSVSRSVITVNPEFDIDQIGIPRHMAMKQYAPHVQRELVKQGYGNVDAVKQIKDNSRAANKVLDELVKTMPVVYSRAPAWHKYNVIAGWPSITDGDSISVNPYVLAGLSGDLDGDCQVNTMVAAFPKDLVTVQPVQNNKATKNNSHFYLTGDINGFTIPVFGERTIKNMYNSLKIPMLSSDSHVITQVDLADFPRGEFAFETEGTMGGIYFHKAIPGTKVIARDDNTGELVWADVSHFSEHPARFVEVVSLKNGNHIVTDNDQRAIYGMDPKNPEMKMERFTPTDAWSKNVQVPVVRNLKSPLDCLENLTHIKITEDESCPFHTIPLDFNFGWFLGALAGDGWWDKIDYATGFHKKFKNGARLLNLSDLKGMVAERMENFIRTLVPENNLWIHRQEMKKENHSGRYGDTVKHTYAFEDSIYLTEFLTRELGGLRTDKTSGSATKKLPGFFLNGPEEFRRGLFCGLIDTDGSCSVSNAKGKPQLIITMSSTSMRLLRDVRLLLKSLNVQSSLSFSKLTTADNESWMLNVSAVDAKDVNLLSGLATDYKLKNFIETTVYMGPGPNQKHNRYVFPEVIYKLFKRNITCPKIKKSDREGAISAEELVFRKKHQNAYQVLNTALVEGSITKFSFNTIMEAYTENRNNEIANVNEVCKALRTKDVTWLDNFDEDKVTKLRNALRSVAQYTSADISGDLSRLIARTSRPYADGVLSFSFADELLVFLTTNSVAQTITESPIFVDWYKTIFSNSEVSWTSIDAVEYTGKLEDGYDLTVPGHETFMALDGTILSNTVTVHLPAMKESQEEAKNILMPSKMVLSTKREDTVVPALKHEQVLGLFTAKNKPSQAKHTFNTREEALVAIKKGDVRLSDEVEILAQ